MQSRIKHSNKPTHPVVTMSATLSITGVLSSITTPAMFALVNQQENMQSAVLYGTAVTSVALVVTMVSVFIVFVTRKH